MEKQKEEHAKGRVYIVGTGPGDPRLITVRGLGCLREADAVVYDRLIDPELLSEARRSAELIYVGKESGKHLWPQERINGLLVKLALNGNVDPLTPVAVIEQGSRAGQKITVTNLQDIGQDYASVRPPAVIVIGRTISLNSVTHISSN